MYAGHVLALHDSADLRLETHVEHPIGLIKDKVANVREADAPALDQIHQTTRSGAEEVTPPLNLPQLLVDVSTAVDHGRADPGAVAELAGLVVDLADQLTSRGEDKGRRVCLAAAAEILTTLRLCGGSARTVGEGRRENGEKETACLPRTRLRIPVSCDA